MQSIPREAELSTGRFLDRYVEANQPVVVVDALASMDLAGKWSPSHLDAHYGNELVQVYDDYFDLTGVSSLSDYLAQNFGKQFPKAPVPYVRWYTKLRDVEFIWADEPFSRMSADWVTPPFFPKTDLALPHTPAPQTRDPGSDRFPARGLFISGKGARTGLHVDPWGSCALLCQLYGEKEWVMYGPDQAGFLRSGSDVVDLDNPDRVRFPLADRATCTYRFRQRAGEVVYVPHGWFHAVRSVSDSVSFTWNFVHERTRHALQRWLDESPGETDLDIVRFFAGAPGLDAIRRQAPHHA